MKMIFFFSEQSEDFFVRQMDTGCPSGSKCSFGFNKHGKSTEK